MDPPHGSPTHRPALRRLVAVLAPAGAHLSHRTRLQLASFCGPRRHLLRALCTALPSDPLLFGALPPTSPSGRLAPSIPTDTSRPTRYSGLPAALTPPSPAALTPSPAVGALCHRRRHTILPNGRGHQLPGAHMHHPAHAQRVRAMGGLPVLCNHLCGRGRRLLRCRDPVPQVAAGARGVFDAAVDTPPCFALPATAPFPPFLALIPQDKLTPNKHALLPETEPIPPVHARSMELASGAHAVAPTSREQVLPVAAAVAVSSSWGEPEV